MTAVRSARRKLSAVPTASPSPAEGPVPVRLSDVEPEPIEWIWRNRLARGKKTLVAGDPGQGKSLLTIDITSRITCGGPWPDSGRAAPGNVLFLCVEDGLADTVRPRIDAAGGDPSRVVRSRWRP